MALREAAIRLTLQSGGFVGGLQQVTRQVQTASAKMKAALSSSMSAGLAGARSGFASLKNDITGTLKSAASLGGMFAAGAAIKSGLDLQQTYRDLAFNLSMATGEATRWEDVQKTIEPAALKTSRTSKEMAAAFAMVFQSTGNAKFAAESLEAIGDAATASGKPVEQLAAVAQILQRKYGAAAADLPDLFAVVLEKADAGGASFEQLVGGFDRLAGEAKRAGLEGKAGLALVLGMLQTLDTELGADRAMIGVRQMLQYMKDGTSQMRAFEKASGIKFEAGDDMIAKLRKVAAGGEEARSAFNAAFTSPEVRNVFDELIKPFDAAVNKATEAGASPKEALEAGMTAFDASMKKMASSTSSAADMAKAAAVRGQEPQRKLAQAMELFTEEFTKPEMLDALNELAKSLPKVAQGIAKLVSFTINNPLLAAGGYAGLRIGAPAASQAVMSLGEQGLKAAGSKLAAMFAADVAAHGKWGAIGKTVGAAAGIAIAAYVAYELGKAKIDEALDKDENLLNKLNIAAKHAETVAADPRASEEAKRNALEELKAARKAKEAEGMSGLTAVFGGAAAAITGDKSLDPAERNARARADARRMERVLEGQLGGTSEGAKRAAAAFTILTNEARNAANELKKVKPGGDTGNGPPAPPGNAPGHD